MSAAYQYIPAPLGLTLSREENIRNGDLIRMVLSAIPKAVDQLENFAIKLPLINNYDKARYIWQSLKDRVRYKKDDINAQRIKLPGRLISDGVGDCKSIAVFIAGALTAAKIPNGLIFASYRKGPYSHVYNYAILNGKKIFIDGCLPRFDYQTKYFDAMNAEILAGPGEEIGKSAKAKKRQQRREERRAQGKGFFQRAGKAAKKISLAPARGAFLGLVALNVRGLAYRLKRSIEKAPAKLDATWIRLGGDPKKLKAEILKGAAKKALGESEEEILNGYGIGFAVATTAATAAPVLILIIKEVSKILGDKENKELSDLTGQAFKDNPEILTQDTAVADPDPQAPAGAGQPEKTGFQVNPWLIGGGVLLLGGIAYVATKGSNNKKSKR
jgi:hypothetical protein